MTSTLIQHLQGRGFSLAVVAGSLQVHPASRLTVEDRDLLRSHAAAILEHLNRTPTDTVPSPMSGPEPWDTRVALRLMEEADGLVERLGVNGQHPAVADAAAMVERSHATRDLGTLRSAVAQFTALVHRLGQERSQLVTADPPEPAPNRG